MIDHEQALANAKAAAQAMVDDVADAARLAERARCVKLLREQAGNYPPEDVEHTVFSWAAKIIEAP